jgi:hypothetical protein
MAVVALSTRNPYYVSREIDWTIMRDSYGGERYVKDKGQDYLPPTGTMVQDGLGFNQPGLAAYEAYKTRAVYHELVKPSMLAMLGVMHRKEPDIELPPKMEGMRKRASFNGESLCQLLVRINEQQMLMGRLGLLLDVQTDATINDLPYLVTYNAEQMTNWDSTKVTDDNGARQLKLVVLDETQQERGPGLMWVNVMKYRVLARAGDVRDVWDIPGVPDNTYVAAEVRNTQDATSAQFVQPSFGGRTLEKIPFVFIGPRDLVPEPDAPVLLPMARLALAIYRTEADYRQALYMQGQDTLVTIGGNSQAGEQQKVGAFGSINMPMGGDAKYIGADSGGISDLRASIDSDFARAAQLGAQLLTERGNEAEAAGALNIRVAARTATLTTVADAGAAGLESILKSAAIWLGADPDKVEVHPNKDFVDDAAQAQDLTYLMTGKTMGAPLSNMSIHAWLAKREFTTMTYEEEMSQKDKEGPDLPGLLPGVRGAPGKAPVPGAAPRGAKTTAKAAGATTKY